MAIESGQTWLYIKTNNPYIIVGPCKIRMEGESINRVWLDGIVYKNSDELLFVRKIEDFLENFRKWEE